MHPELIKAEMRMAGYTCSSLADELAISCSSVSAVIAGRGASRKTQVRIAQIIGKPVAAVWPKKDSSLRRMKVVAHG